GRTTMDSRPRRSTLETFNEEMALLDRPLENEEIEYYDEEPPRRPWRRLGAFVVVAAIGVAGGAFGGARVLARAKSAVDRVGERGLRPSEPVAGGAGPSQGPALIVGPPAQI